MNILCSAGLASCRWRPLISNVSLLNFHLPPMFQSTVTHIRLSYAIDGQLIAIGNTTWQTKNLTSVSVEQAKLTVGIPTPLFKLDEPSRRFYWGWLLLAIAAAWTWSLSFERPPLVGIPATILACGAMWFVGHYSHRDRMNLWIRAREKSARQKSIWRSLVEKPVEIFSLVLDSSSGKSVALKTFNLSSINAVHAAILEAMRSTGNAPLQGTIEAIETNPAELEKSYEKFCIEEVTSA